MKENVADEEHGAKKWWRRLQVDEVAVNVRRCALGRCDE